MKKLFISLILLTLNILAIAQTPITPSMSEEELMYYNAYGLLAKNEHKEALKAAQEALTVVKNDSLKAETHFIIGACYGGLSQVDEAVAEFNKAIEVYSQAYEAGSNFEAKMHAHSAHFLNMAERVEEAYGYAMKSMDIYLKTLPNNRNMAQSAMLVAEISFKQKKYQDAISYQRITLLIYESLLGRHNEEYLSEMDYMATYLTADGQQEEADKIRAELERLKKEAENGYVPQDVKFTSKEQCRLYNEDAFYAAKYYLSHQVTADSMAFVAKYLDAFGSMSSDIIIFHGHPEAAWRNDSGTTWPWLSSAYAAGFIYYQLQNPERFPSLDAYIYGNLFMCGFYASNRKYLEDSKTLDNYLKLNQDDPKKLKKLLSDQYAATMKHMESALKIAQGLESNVITEHPIIDGIFGK